MSHQNSGTPAKQTRLQLDQHMKDEHPEEKTEKFDEDISLEEALSTL